MKILLVCSGNVEFFNFEKHHAFIYDQINAISRQFPDVRFENYFVKGLGVIGYLKNIKKINRKIRELNPDLIHAHGGHIGFLCVFQKKIPVVTTFHGSDINSFYMRFISAFAALFSTFSIFVSTKLKSKAIIKGSKNEVIPCGVDFDMFFPLSKEKAKAKLGLAGEIRYILFASHKDNRVKNYRLAYEATSSFKNIMLLEIKNRIREEVNYLINGAELLLMTSFTEGSPQVIKEAMACNCPIVSVNVGDVEEIIRNTHGAFLCHSYDLDDIKEKIRAALRFDGRTNGRENIERFDNRRISKELYAIYENLH